ncbi:MAG TPA: hypothetical protein PKW08_07140 [Flavobacteriaceae bacterium]|nr:hypothetical protein [Flavobacteriaceae bacterium]MCB9212786.1 hypothetical protein [Alteromonas sp.]HPF10048.1 hypothetical protein [Flavobacteriaceae bacterium]HQU21347.1 hypothetical protein [Flavobacteriaceae bacterium]HQU63869.1 hypothetical protein [Flavobacteriaceae bacterium]
MKKALVLLLWVLVGVSAQSQTDNAFFERIEAVGAAKVQPFREGQIEFLKGTNPPPKTWNYADMVRFAEDLAKEELILMGSYIEPSQREGFYGYNFFAYRKEGETYEYYFALILDINTNNDFQIAGSYLFTDKDSLKSWWSHTFYMYYEGLLEAIPEQFRYPVCPPPPFED